VLSPRDGPITLGAIMKSDARTAAAYLRELPADRKPGIARLRAMVTRALPEAKETMAHGMPTYILGDEPVVALASQKGYMALYVCDTAVLEKWKKKLGRADCGKSCIRFKDIDGLDVEVVDSILGEAAERAVARASP
jgi:uncharacterized protein YdhG (YjbR/CyaY superfamily)